MHAAPARGTRAQTRATAKEAVQPAGQCCPNRRSKAWRAKAQADKQSLPASSDAPHLQSEVASDAGGAASTAVVADSRQHAQPTAAGPAESPPQPEQVFTADRQAPAAEAPKSARAMRAARRDTAGAQLSPPAVPANKSASSLDKRKQCEEASDTAPLPMRPMPTKSQRRQAPSSPVSQQADRQAAAAAQPAGPAPGDMPSHTLSPPDLPSGNAAQADVCPDKLAAGEPQVRPIASAQDPQQCSVAQTSEAAESADAGGAHSHSPQVTQDAAAAVTDAAAAASDGAAPGVLGPRRSGRNHNTTVKAEEAGANLVKQPKLTSDPTDEAPPQQACSPASRGTKRAADQGSDSPAAAVPSAAPSVARKRRRQAVGLASCGALASQRNTRQSARNESADVEFMTQVSTDDGTAMYLDGTPGKRRKAFGSRGRRQADRQNEHGRETRGSAQQPHTASAPSLCLLVKAAERVEAGLPCEAEVENQLCMDNIHACAA